MLRPENTLVVIIDVQEKLVKSMHEAEALLDGQRRLIAGARVLEVPVLLTEQNPAGLGATVAPVAELLEGAAPIVKTCFSCCDSEEFMAALEAAGRRNLLLAGVETHVCVYQTAAALAAAGFHVEVVADACSSRSPYNKQIGLEKARAAGAEITCVETALFELLAKAEGPRFKQLLKIVK